MPTISNKNEADGNFKKCLEKTVINCFIWGLRPELEWRVGESTTLSGIIGKALEIERKLSACDALRKRNLVKQKELENFSKK